MPQVDPVRLKQISFFIIVIVLGGLIFSELSMFVRAFLGSVTFYVLMRKSMRNMVYKRKWNPNLSAAILLFLSVLIVLVPIWTFINMMLGKINEFSKNSTRVIAAIEHFSDKIQSEYNFRLLSTENLNKAGTVLANTVPNVLGATFNTLFSLVVMYFILFFMLVQSKELEAWLIKYVPLKNENVLWIGKDLQELVFNNAIGVPLIALLQGVVGLVGYLLIGVPDPWFWFVITCFAAMLPFVGAAMAYVPLGILILAQGPAWKGIVVLIYGFGVIGLVDNIFRFVLQKRLGDVHPLITVLGVILGVNMFGFIGLIFGPILISLFILLVRIYVKEYGENQIKS